ncbi:Major facilitator superfamily domain-containing 6 [Micractinium conductrix]|uniref:Major facilitator superfamily domain-containing 6 n=1 Tax=Micractinium conductrix TaxID=554055 RepID=A0A2P6VFU5_9CHLO|nr:Major facilitator superfamily domain-containing 6 [Micractinium conductrix]|eukprot:PSC72947.1 Major facilitator superfamily domain-containing 6 [Micractinium conductrix]
MSLERLGPLRSSLVVSAADASQRHLVVLLCCYVTAWLGRSLIPFFVSFAAQLAIALVTEAAASPQGALIDSAVMASSPDDGGYGRTRLWGSVGWGAVAPLAGWVVSRYGLTAAFLTFTAVVGLSLLLAVLLPMEALSQRAQCCADGATGAAGRAVSDAGSDKLGGGGKGGRRSSLEGESLLSVHVSAGSATAGKPALPASPTSWAIGSTLEGLPGGAAKPAKPAPGSRPVVSLIAVASSATGLASPERPLLAAVASGSPSPQRQPAPSAADATTTSSLEIDAGSPRGGAAPAQQAAGGAGSGASVWQGVRVLLRDPHVLAFFFLAFAMEAPGTLLGLCLSFNCAAEVPVFFFSGPILERLGVERSLHVAMAAYLARLSYYLALPLLPSPWWVLPAELLNGLTLALAWSAGTVHIRHIAPPHLRGTVQSVFQGLYAGIGSGLGGLAGGLIYGSAGASALFRTGLFTLAAAWLGSAVALRLWGGPGGQPAGHVGGAAAAAAAAVAVAAAAAPSHTSEATTSGQLTLVLALVPALVCCLAAWRRLQSNIWLLCAMRLGVTVAAIRTLPAGGPAQGLLGLLANREAMLLLVVAAVLPLPPWMLAHLQLAGLLAQWLTALLPVGALAWAALEVAVLFVAI